MDISYDGTELNPYPTEMLAIEIFCLTGFLVINFDFVEVVDVDMLTGQQGF